MICEKSWIEEKKQLCVDVINWSVCYNANCNKNIFLKRNCVNVDKCASTLTSVYQRWQVCDYVDVDKCASTLTSVRQRWQVCVNADKCASTLTSVRLRWRWQVCVNADKCAYQRWQVCDYVDVDKCASTLTSVHQRWQVCDYVDSPAIHIAILVYLKDHRIKVLSHTHIHDNWLNLDVFIDVLVCVINFDSTETAYRQKPCHVS